VPQSYCAWKAEYDAVMGEPVGWPNETLLPPYSLVPAGACESCHRPPLAPRKHLCVYCLELRTLTGSVPFPDAPYVPDRPRSSARVPDRPRMREPGPEYDRMLGWRIAAVVVFAVMAVVSAHVPVFGWMLLPGLALVAMALPGPHHRRRR
jgi:hypothetical protein